MAKKKVKKSKSSKKFELSYLNKISKLSLENFKGFSNRAEFEFSPGINLIYGKNSSGKSSIIQAIRLLKQSLHIVNSPSPFHLVVPTYMQIPGSLVFSEGFEGLINEKKISKDLTLGIGTFGKGYITNKKKWRKERYLEYKFNNQNKDTFPTIKKIYFSGKDKYEKHQNIKDDALLYSSSNCELVLKGKEKFTNNSLAKLLTDVWKDRRTSSSGRGYNILRILENSKKNTEQSENDLTYEVVDIKKSKFNFGVFDVAHKKIIQNLKKFKKSINKNIDFGLKENIFGIQPTNITKMLQLNYKSRIKKSKSQQFINVGEFSTINKNDLESFKKFVNSKSFEDLTKFKNFLYRDFIKKLNLIRYKDSIIDINFEKANHEASAQAWKKGVLSSPRYEIYLFNLVLSAIDMRLINLSNQYEDILDDIRFSVQGISVVPGLRELPSRYLKRGLEERFIGEKAENLGDVLSKKKTQAKVNRWFEKFEIPYQIDTKLVGNFYELVMKPKNTKSYDLSYKDVGLGYSLSLPLIVTALISERSTILCEEPELHLHPKMQAALMELFIYSSLENKNQFIIETHSENLLLRAQKMIRKGFRQEKKTIPINKDHISIHNIFIDGKGSESQKIIIDDKGEFKTHWKDGFFAERLDELF